ncbi:MAG: RES family NAD+ phosphorylase [Acidobacteriota bacterium]|nr:RES family NAD+ phosphorylase [Acidobacteriota bacterium]
MRIFRLHGRQRAASDYSGSLRFASRWNPAGTPVLYASTALSLACLELLVHVGPDQIPLNYIYTAAEIPLDPAAHDFRGSLRDSEATRRYGHGWATSQKSLAIYVPSVIIPVEFNVLLNPIHAAFQTVKWDDPKPFAFDPRLLRGSSAVL